MKKIALIAVATLVVGQVQAQWNLSTRGYAGLNERCLIAGFIVGGTEFNVLVVRGLGPTLAIYNVEEPLADPCLQLHDAQGNLLATQESYLEANAEDLAFLQAKNLIPDDQRECAIVWRVTPGRYTAVVRGQSNTVGMALVELYYFKVP